MSLMVKYERHRRLALVADLCVRRQCDMSDRETIFELVLVLLIYSGPVVPLAATLLFRKASPEGFRLNCRLLLVLTGLQVASFLPYLYFGFITRNSDALYALYLPFGVGALLFASTLIYFIVFVVGCVVSSVRRKHDHKPSHRAA